MDLRTGIYQTAQALGMNPRDLATIISYETGGTFDPTKRGPTTKYGQHRGLIQFGEPQARKFGVDWNNPLGSQLGPNGAVANYFRASGYKPGMGLMDAYSVVNAGAPGRYNASDAAAGGAPGTVADKVNMQMAGHRAKAEALLDGASLPGKVGGDSMVSRDFDPQVAAATNTPTGPLSQSIFGSMSPSTGSIASSGIDPDIAALAYADKKKSLGDRLSAAGKAFDENMPQPPRVSGGGDARQSGNMLLSALSDKDKLLNSLIQKRAPWLA